MAECLKCGSLYRHDYCESCGQEAPPETETAVDLILVDLELPLSWEQVPELDLSTNA